ncbi:DUF3131 domain-containing protein [Ruania suaedae]|uniref:glucoamylase family protein n=1 Tax=Ruania suaedae TaxID=2897774 RepID=UPI001E5782D6|nr:glucoamylase family protein [Ruania suaedae]UFU02719.1 DUF3131 domain-containing protein [Ruania suaedae]
MRARLTAVLAGAALALTPLAAAAAPPGPGGQFDPGAPGSVADRDNGAGNDWRTTGGQPPWAQLDRSDRAQVRQWAADTWASMDAMTAPSTGLPADNIEGDLSPASRSGYTSPTNIGSYLWSTVVARDLGLISRADARERMSLTLETLASMENHEASGLYFNWYDEASGDLLDEFDSGEQIDHFVSTVDNGWLAAAFMIVRHAEPALREQAQTLLDEMDFSYFYNPDARGGDLPGWNRGGFWTEQPPAEQCAEPANYGEPGGEDLYYTCHHYDVLNSETRIAVYVGIAQGQIPAEGYYSLYRTMPGGCDWSWQEQEPVGETVTHQGVEVFQGTYGYDEMRFVPTWGGAMFEELMPDMIVPEARWGADSWAMNHPAAVETQIRHGEEAYGYWGFSPSSDPFAGYREYGVDLAGIQSDGYTSDVEKTDADIGYGDCREAANPDPEYGTGVMTPHAAFLGMYYAPQAALENLDAMATDLGAYGPGGFYDAVATDGTVAERYLSLDQGMVMGAVGNVLGHDALHRYFARGEVRQVLAPLIAAEDFGAVGPGGD